MAAINLSNYYCHRCDREVHISGEGTCLTCNDGFIERIESDNSIESEDDTMNFFHVIHHVPSGSGSNEANDGSLWVHNRDPNNRNEVFGQLIQNLFGNLLPLDFRSDPSDYIFSEQSFDNIVTRIMNQFEQPGPPPARKTDIDRLPVRIVSSVKEGETCSICLSEYAVDDKVSELPCQHDFHQSCVLAWLTKHGTCPICRKDLSGNDTATENHDAEFTD